MANYFLKIDLLKFAGATITEQNGIKGVFIPIEQAGLFQGQKGVYADLQATAMQSPQYGDTHCVKTRIGKDKYQTMNEEERRAIPILGGMREQIYQQQMQAQYPPQPYPAPYPGQYPPQPMGGWQQGAPQGYPAQQYPAYPGQAQQPQRTQPQPQTLGPGDLPF